ncbi:MAG: enoyl-CoA hydratase/isomerase family protein [Burkholderiaceae bacterium]|nr:enoyl-CoA hydratase/isomerase family protein [Burkholderiaceae bacterium]
MSGGTICVRSESHESGALVAHLTIDNSARLNSLHRRLMDDFARAMAQLSSDPALRAVVLTGAGDKAFVGGADIDEMAVLDAAGARAFITAVHRCCAAVRECPVPVIARIAGHTLGAGLELAASCDLRIAVEGARFGMPEVRLGIPSVVEAALLPTLIGWGRTRRMLLLGETFSAQQMLAWGLLEEVVPAGSLDATVQRSVEALLAGGPQAIRLQKALIRRWEELPLADAIAAGIDVFARAYQSDEPASMFARFRAAHRARKAGGG